jgi:hypothetical protein
VARSRHLGTKFQHLIGGVPLFIVGVSKLAGDAAERPVAILEIVVALGVFATFLKELRAATRGAHLPVGWFDLAAGAMLIFEAFHGAHHKPGYLRPQFLAGVSTIGVGLFHARIHHFKKRRSYLKLDHDGLEFRRAPFRRLTVPWADLAKVELQQNQAILHRKNGRQHNISFKRFRNSKELRQGLADHAGPAGLLP